MTDPEAIRARLPERYAPYPHSASCSRRKVDDIHGECEHCLRQRAKKREALRLAEHKRADQWRNVARELAETLDTTARENHDPTGTKWHHPGTRYVACSFEECEGPDCKDAHIALARYREMDDA